jgi:hypothetical protein
MSVPSILSKRHDQGGQPNGNQKHRPIHDVEAKEPCRRGFILIIKHVALARFSPNDGSRSAVSNKRRQHEVARIYRSTLRIMVTQQSVKSPTEPMPYVTEVIRPMRTQRQS